MESSMKTVVVILVILLVVVAAILILAAMKPATFRITRATSINAPPEKIFPLIADFHRWALWSPWEKMDPALKRTYAVRRADRAPSTRGRATARSARGAWRLST